MINKKGLSAVISVILIIGLTVAAGGAVFAVVKNFTQDKLKNSKTCLNALEEIEINNDYTCYNASDDLIEFSLSRKDISLDYLLISITFTDPLGRKTKTMRFTDQEQVVGGVLNYPSKTTGISLPGNESGKTYLFTWGSTAPEKIQIAPSIGNKQCDVIDEILDIQTCI